MKFQLYLILLAILFITALFYSCSDEPSSLGIEILESENILAKIFDSSTDTTEQNSSFFKRVIPLGNSAWFLLGRYQTYQKPLPLMKFIFGLPDSIERMT